MTSITGNTPDEIKISIPKKNIISAARSRFIRLIHEINLFSNHPFWSSILTPSEQIFSTRLFLLLVLTSLLTVIGYAGLTTRTYEVTMNKFSMLDFERLEARYPTTINAPCTEMSITYNKFLKIFPQFHQVCSSSFVEKEWISSLFLPNATSHNILDFRTIAVSHFRALSLLCKIAYQTLNDMHKTFNSSHLVHRNAFSRIQFNEIAAVLINNLQRDISTNERRTAKVLSMITSGNRLLSALRTNYYVSFEYGPKLHRTYNGVYLSLNDTENSTCDCQLQENQCVYPAGAFYNWTTPTLGEAAQNTPPPLFQIPGIMAGCMPFDSMRQSTLECLYNQSCVNSIALQPKISRPKALNVSLTRFPLDSTIGHLFDGHLFIESWQNEWSYEKYFAACEPKSLSYSYESRFHLHKMIKMGFSALSGIILAWQLMTPVIIIIWKRITRRKTPMKSEVTLETEEIQSESIKTVVKGHVHRTVYNFNLYRSNGMNDPDEERVGIIATRLNILLMLISLFILGFYISFSENNKTYTINSPSMSAFEALHLKYPSKLTCPCSNFSMSNARVISLAPRFHAICSSQFLEDDWLSYFGRVEIDIAKVKFLSVDFRAYGKAFFDLLRTLCETSKGTVKYAIKVFGTHRLVTVNALTRFDFDIETRKRLKQFEQRTISSFMNLLELLRSSIQTNQLAEGTWANLGPFTTYNNDTSKFSLRFVPRHFYTNSCSCAISSQCTRPVGFYSQHKKSYDKPSIIVPGLVLGCFPLESLLSSTLECFHEKNCTELLVQGYYFDVVGLVWPLNKNATEIQPIRKDSSRFSPNSTINEILSHLFVEDWNNLTNFTAYYRRCAPSQCTYTRRMRFDTAYTLTIMVCFYGSLSVILQILVPPLVRKILKRLSKQKQQVSLDNANNVPIDPLLNDQNSAAKNGHHNMEKVSNKFLSLNLFQNEYSPRENRFLRLEIMASRIYIFLFVLCIMGILIYAARFNDETKSVTIEFPSIEIVNKLHKQNIPSLTCPCSKVAIPNSKFLSIQQEYHSICSSEYVSPSYYSELFKRNDSTSLALSVHYRLLSSLCQLSDRFIEKNKKDFGYRELVSVDTLTHDSFDRLTQASISRFISQISADYRRTLSFIVQSFSVNQILNLLAKNWQTDFAYENDNLVMRPFPRDFPSSNCSCVISADCSEPLIDDIAVGCYPYDGFRLSKFKNISLEILNNQLFVETWTNESNYTKYFNACQPLRCQYTLIDKDNPILILTTLLENYGSLTFVLSLLIGQTLLAYEWWIKNSTMKTSRNSNYK